MTGAVKRNWQGLKAHGRNALRQHLLSVAERAASRHGPHWDGAALAAVLDDREVVRFPTTVAFEARGLTPGTFGRTVWAEDLRRCTLHVHPHFQGHPELPLLVLYLVPTISYGRMPTADDCLAFGAMALGLHEDEYHARLCALTDAAAL
ncbi:MAG: hypothetical protein KC613_11115 [Myxococcales bacterium]|nr:hypothetical protein [Myxococcales bacterium]